MRVCLHARLHWLHKLILLLNANTLLDQVNVFYVPSVSFACICTLPLQLTGLQENLVECSAATCCGARYLKLKGTPSFYWQLQRDNVNVKQWRFCINLASIQSFKLGYPQLTLVLALRCHVCSNQEGLVCSEGLLRPAAGWSLQDKRAAELFLHSIQRQAE